MFVVLGAKSEHTASVILALINNSAVCTVYCRTAHRNQLPLTLGGIQGQSKRAVVVANSVSIETVSILRPKRR